jgi:hypothetical protein
MYFDGDVLGHPDRSMIQGKDVDEYAFYYSE